MTAFRNSWPVLLCLLYFVAAGILILPYPGIENDEALFANGVYAPDLMPGQVEVFGRTVPTMVMPYVGALKTWTYWVIFNLIPSSRWSVRLPMILAGAAGIWFFYRFLYRIAGRRPALIGAVLLATDVSYLLTITFDRGPVAPQQFLVAGGLLLAVRAWQQRSEPSLAAAFFLFGLALWDKVVFVWMFSGITVAAIAVFHRELLRFFTLKRLAIAGTAFLIGAFPFVLYNATSNLGTFRGNQPASEQIDSKIAVMRATIDGIVLSRYLIDHDTPPVTPDDAGPVERASIALRDWIDGPLISFLGYAVGLSLLLAPLAWKQPGGRALLFFLLAFAIAWAQMLFTNRAGGSSHHTVLVLFHVIGFVSVALSLAANRLPRLTSKAVALAVTSVVASNLLLFNAHLAGLVRHGPARFWSDALYPLCDYVESLDPPVVYTTDWGMDYSLRLFLEWYTPVWDAISLHPRPEINDVERSRMNKRLSQPEAVYVGYVDGKEVFPEAKRLVRLMAEQQGYRKDTLQLVRDSRDREIFEVFRFVRPE